MSKILQNQQEISYTGYKLCNTVPQYTTRGSMHALTTELSLQVGRRGWRVGTPEERHALPGDAVLVVPEGLAQLQQIVLYEAFHHRRDLAYEKKNSKKEEEEKKIKYNFYKINVVYSCKSFWAR